MNHPDPTRRRRRRHRSNERGAALTEAVVSIPFFLLMFSCILFAGRVYETKLRVMKSTRQSAWNYAMCNCGEKGDAATSKCQPPDAMPATAGSTMAGSPPDPALGSAGTGPGSNIASKDFGSSKSEGSMSVTSDVFLQGVTKTMKSQTQVMCNEAPHNGDLKGWLQAAFGAATNW